MAEAERLAQALESMPEHSYQGLCPAPDTSPTARDPDCQACQILVQAAAELRRLSADAQRLDWLERRLFEGKWTGTIGQAKSWSMAGPYRHTLQQMRGETLRAAIDQAMKDTP